MFYSNFLNRNQLSLVSKLKIGLLLVSAVVLLFILQLSGAEFLLPP